MTATFTPGLPPAGAQGAYFGRDAQGNIYLLRWHETNGWEALGWTGAGKAAMPALRHPAGQDQGLIVGHADIATTLSTAPGPAPVALRDALTSLYNHTDDPRMIEEIRKVVERFVFAHVEAGGGGVVKPLEWRKYRSGDQEAVTPFGVVYTAYTTGYWRTNKNPKFVASGKDISSAMAGANADWAATVRSLIEEAPSPAPVSAPANGEVVALSNWLREFAKTQSSSIDRGLLNSVATSLSNPASSREVEPVAWHCIGSGEGWWEDKIIRHRLSAEEYASRAEFWTVRPLVYGEPAPGHGEADQ